MKKTTITTSLEEFDKTQLMDKRLIDKASLWILRIILNLGRHRELIDKYNGVSKDTILAFLDGNQFLDKDEDKFTREKTLAFFKDSLINIPPQYVKTTILKI